MADAYFGTKELYEVVLKANNPMNFGYRQIERGEPVLYFKKVAMAQLNENNQPIMARGGWGNMPYVVWEDRSEMTFSMTEGVMNSVGMGILTSAKVFGNNDVSPIFVPKLEGPTELDTHGSFYLSENPQIDDERKGFCFEFENDVIQKKVGYRLEGKRVFVENGDPEKFYIFDYYYRYNKDSLTYLIEKERFNGTFSLEGKFYTKDEVEGNNYTNLLIIPKIRVVSDINLRLGERADPTTSVFNVIAMPQRWQGSNMLLMKMVRLGEDVDGEV